jgi:2-iminobutanoate/2-iminopropanoate deaminase
VGEVIKTSSAPAALGPYSQGIRASDFVFASGQLGLDPATVLKTAGASLADVVKTTIFLADMADFQTVNAIYGARFAGAPPARSTVQVAALPKGGRVEIEMIAYAP